MCSLFSLPESSFLERRSAAILENKFKTKLIHELEVMFPGCIVLHMDANSIQGIPDLLILYGNEPHVFRGIYLPREQGGSFA